MNLKKDDVVEGQNDQIQECISMTTEGFMKLLEPKILRYKKQRFLYKVYVKKLDRELPQQKECALQLIKNNVIKIQSHLISLAGGNQSLFRNSYECSLTNCPWKALVILLSEIQNGPGDDLEIRQNYAGFLIFTGFQGKHRTTGQQEYKVMPRFEDLPEIFEYHEIPRNNLAGIKKAKKSSAFRNAVQQKNQQDVSELKFGQKQIPEIKILVKRYQLQHTVYKPSEVLEYVAKWILKFKTRYDQNQQEAETKEFAGVMLTYFNHVQIEDKHLIYQDVEMKETSQNESIFNYFEEESGLQNLKLKMKLQQWNQSEAEQTQKTTWMSFCRVLDQVDKKDVLPWVYPSVDFTGSDNIRCSKRIQRTSLDKITNLETLTYRNGRKQTENDKTQMYQYESLANMMDVDIKYQDADFKSVSVKIANDKIQLLKQIQYAKKEADVHYYEMKDAEIRLKHSNDRLFELEENLKRNDQLSKKWLHMAPTVISRALEAQAIKVEQVNTHLDEQAKVDRINDKQNYDNQFSQAKDKFVPKLEAYGEENQSIQVKKESSQNIEVNSVKQIGSLEIKLSKMLKRKRREGLIQFQKAKRTMSMWKRKNEEKRIKGCNNDVKSKKSSLSLVSTQNETEKTTLNEDQQRLASQQRQVSHLKNYKIQESPSHPMDLISREAQNNILDNYVQEF